MKKIPSIFERDWKGDKSRVTREINRDCKWVFDGIGTPTRKWDGTACMVEAGKLFKRYDAKNGKTPPEGFIPTQKSPDQLTGHWPGWLPVTEADKWHCEAFKDGVGLLPGTYELCGPKVQGNPEGLNSHILIPHGEEILTEVPLDFDGLREYLSSHDIEGIVWWNPDGRMAKIKAKDFGIERLWYRKTLV